MATTDKEITIDKYRREYGKGIAKCFSEVYGDGYPIKSVYDPDMLQEEFIKGNFYPVVALNDRNEVIGVMAIYRSSPAYHKIYEAGAGIVLPEYRGKNIATMLFQYLSERLSGEFELEEIFGESVCNHTKIQKMVVHNGYLETGIEIDLMPFEAYTREASSSGRVSTTIHFLCLKDKPQDIFVPEVYTKELEFLYLDSKRKRTLIPSKADIPSGSVTTGNHSFFEFARVNRLTITTIGEDIGSFIENVEKRLLVKGMYVSQVFLRLDCSWIGRAIDVLRTKGYFLGGTLPRWFDADGIFMQKIYGKPNWDGINLYSSRAKKILTFIRADWERTQH
ncbi:MAG TPA: GNAT family N-acetyltransferase [Syntrophorhabdaceae bacterium]|nr:GNAT family N-acetyltransferase [Syntrophorhabdaceae bacterium]